MLKRNRTRAAAPAAEPEPALRPTPLEMYGAVLAPNLRGAYVYAFSDPDGGPVFYTGQSGNLWSRWRDHYYRFKARFTEADKWIIPVENQARADMIELVLIDFYQPACNEKGKVEDLQRKVRRWNQGGVNFGKADSLDSGQATG